MRFEDAKRTARECFFGYFEHHLAGSAAELSYYFLFSAFSVIMATGAVAVNSLVVRTAIEAIGEALLPQLVFDMLEEYISSFGEADFSAVFCIGVLLAVYAVARYVNCLKRKIREIYGIESNVGLLRDWLISLLLSVFIIVGFYITFAFQILGEGLLNAVSESLYFIPTGAIKKWKIIRFMCIGIYAFAMLSVLYRAIPVVRLSFDNVKRGAFFSTVAWLCVSVAFSFYVDNYSSYSTAYGSFGAFVALMLWLFLMNCVILIGALINKNIYTKCEKSVKNNFFEKNS